MAGNWRLCRRFRPLCFEPLEDRQLLAAGLFVDSSGLPDASALPALAQAALPAATTYTISDLTVSRTSSATQQTDQQIQTVAANQPRVESITSAGSLTMQPYGLSNWTPLTVDSTRGLILFTSGAFTTLQAMDATTYAVSTICDTHTHPQLDATKNIAAVKVLPDGTWLLFAGGPDVADGGVTSFGGNGLNPNRANQAVYRSTDAGITWTLTQTQDVASPVDAGMMDTAGSRIAYGPYGHYRADGLGDPTPGNGMGVPIWLSLDGGVTWDEIGRQTLPANVDPGAFHCHHVQFDKTNPDIVYFQCGDGPGRQLQELVRPAGWTHGGGHWTATSLGYDNAGHGMLALSTGKIIIGNRDISLLDPVTGDAATTLFIPQVTTDGHATDYPCYYGDVNGSDAFRTFLEVGGIIYAPMQSYSQPTPDNYAIWASADGGQTWSAVNRVDQGGAIKAWIDPLGYAGGRLWWYANTNTSIDALAPRLYSSNLLSAQPATALRVDLAGQNYFDTSADSTFSSGGSGSLGGWATQYPHTFPQTVETVPGGLDDSGDCLHIVTTTEHGDNSVWSARLSSFVAAGNPLPVEGQHFSLSVWVRSPNCPSDGSYAMALLPYLNGAVVTKEDIFIPTSKWTRHIMTGTFHGDASAIGGGQFRLDVATGGANYHSFDVYVDCIDLRVSDSEWPTTDSFIVGGSPRSNESASFPIAGAGTQWSLAFDVNGWAAREQLADLVLGSLIATDGSYVDVTWRHATKKISITDGTHDVTTPNSNDRWHNDITRVLLVCDGGSTRLYTWDGQNGLQFVDGVDLAPTAAPAEFRIAANHNGTSFGQGLFSGFQSWSFALSDAQAGAMFAQAGPSVSAAATLPWNGLGGDANWTTAANWKGRVAAAPSDNLVFPDAVSGTTNTNDFPADTAFGSLTFSGGGYHISGSRIVLHDGITNSIPAGQANQLTLDIGLASATTSVVADGGDLIVLGTIANSGALTVDGTGTLQASSISGSGSTNVAANARLQTNAIQQHELTIGAGGVLVLGGIGSKAGTSGTISANGPAAPVATANMGNTVAEDTNVVVVPPVSAPVASSEALAATIAATGVAIAPKVGGSPAPPINLPNGGSSAEAASLVKQSLCLAGQAVTPAAGPKARDVALLWMLRQLDNSSAAPGSSIGSLHRMRQPGLLPEASASLFAATDDWRSRDF